MVINLYCQKWLQNLSLNEHNYMQHFHWISFRVIIWNARDAPCWNTGCENEMKLNKNIKQRSVTYKFLVFLLCCNKLFYDDIQMSWHNSSFTSAAAIWSLSGVPDYFDRNKILSGYDLSHYQVPHCIKSFLLFCLICVYSSQFSILF